MRVSRPEVEMDGLYSQRKAAEALGVDRHTVARYAASGHLAFWPRASGGKVTTGAEIVSCWQRLNNDRQGRL